mmetsp:Transcript_81568/g.243205  ORF Transcript_81568/g.243205 Transcript_81568/m.243205 type:complete len:223 (+) Transcript_81568:863-1531(+)
MPGSRPGRQGRFLGPPRPSAPRLRRDVEQRRRSAATQAASLRALLLAVLGSAARRRRPRHLQNGEAAVRTLAREPERTRAAAVSERASRPGRPKAAPSPMESVRPAERAVTAASPRTAMLSATSAMPGPLATCRGSRTKWPHRSATNPVSAAKPALRRSMLPAQGLAEGGGETTASRRRGSRRRGSRRNTGALTLARGQGSAAGCCRWAPLPAASRWSIWRC